MTQLKNLVANGQQVHFQFYRHGELWYTTDSGFEFPVPVEDIGDGVFQRDDKALIFMRYIRKHLENIAQGRSESYAA